MNAYDHAKFIKDYMKPETVAARERQMREAQEKEETENKKRKEVLHTSTVFEEIKPVFSHCAWQHNHGDQLSAFKKITDVAVSVDELLYVLHIASRTHLRDSVLLCERKKLTLKILGLKELPLDDLYTLYRFDRSSEDTIEGYIECAVRRELKKIRQYEKIIAFAERLERLRYQRNAPAPSFTHLAVKKAAGRVSITPWGRKRAQALIWDKVYAW